MSWDEFCEMWSVLEALRADALLHYAVSPLPGDKVVMEAFHFEDRSLGAIHAAFDDKGLIRFEWIGPDAAPSEWADGCPKCGAAS